MFSYLTLIFTALFFVPQVYAAVVINELFPKFDPAWQFVELYNTGDQLVNLDRWKIDHTSGDAKSFTLPASAVIQPHGFLTFYGSQTAINFSTEGDSVRLFDVNGTLVDSQSYLGTLGFSTPMGRSPDGANSWVICSPEPYKATPNASNNCPPAPTPTPIPLPTSTPTPTQIFATPTPSIQTFGTLLSTPTPISTQQPIVLGVTNALMPTPTPENTDIMQFTVNRLHVAYALMGIAFVGLLIMVIMWIRRMFIRRRS